MLNVVITNGAHDIDVTFFKAGATKARWSRRARHLHRRLGTYNQRLR